MRKILLLFIPLIFSGFISKAQVVFSQNFEASMNSMPAGWKQQLNANAPTNGGWQFSNSFPGYFGFIYAPYHTYCAFVDDNDNNNANQLNNDTLYTPSINLSAYTRLYISFDIWFVGYYDTVAAGNFEQANLCVSTNGGLTWTTCDTIYGNNNNYWRTLTFDVTAYAGMSNVKFAFTYTDGGYDAIGEALDNIQIYVPPFYDAGVTSDKLPYLAKVGTSYPIQGILRNYGFDTITSLQLKYRVNGGPIVTDNMNAISIKPLHNSNYTHSTPWVPAITGNNIVKIWTDSINGTNADGVHSNDTVTVTVIVVDSIQPKAVLMEEFTQASCSPCLYFSPQYDSILDSVQLFTNSIRYHVNWPARDMMNDVTQPDVGTRVSYYPVDGVPTPYMDGEYYYTLSYAGLLAEANLGSPFKIILSNATYDGATNKYHIDVAVKSYGVMPAGIRLQVALTVDTMKYVNDQSLAEPQSYFEPPIGVTWGGSPDWLYPYALNYPEVVEKMLPDANGTSMGAFAINQTQNFSFTWTKNRPWADSVHAWVYDSVGTRFTVFIQNNSNKYVYQSAHAIPKNVTGFAELSNSGNDFAVYPNPAANFAILALKMANEQSVSIEIYNMLGDKVYAMDAGSIQAGMHNYKLNTAELNPGVYFVKVISNGNTQVKKLEIVR